MSGLTMNARSSLTPLLSKSANTSSKMSRKFSSFSTPTMCTATLFPSIPAAATCARANVLSPWYSVSGKCSSSAIGDSAGTARSA
eukprot:CAMPEP_0182455848 /NCGR_PEP_ID=MMETSP1319-20130603/1871_1 /TAXON_ID=172717 /ORGANISM="Bolidomonas pacifica, Strain RCC208" /LENGTH=84 /DNA_ID=CAMNT_0024653981 /DNA_START=365 /DNA_END=619 /DNA_ORIENTATION=+